MCAYITSFPLSNSSSEIAGCSQRAYDYMSISDARQMLLFSCDQELAVYVKEVKILLNFGMMDASQLPSSVSAPQEASNYDELSAKQSLNFLDSLKDLKDLRKQLYSAADYFELSYNRHDQKQLVVNTLKDYVTKAFINTVDHLGSLTYKVNCLLDDKIEEAFAIELRFSCALQGITDCS
ncbi:protein ABIL3-like isoform X2 [Syzygium oleosum]|uniref:protein ABIL3-like isoform X2 n=1 Tax=Syzygium oleosum TaxID=219896 RepID=UPI0024BAB627|nr:protein ABIL3-like isoform X2 [Syzygium oleosum]